MRRGVVHIGRCGIGSIGEKPKKKMWMIVGGGKEGKAASVAAGHPDAFLTGYDGISDGI
jgi:hypothetical protein